MLTIRSTRNSYSSGILFISNFLFILFLIKESNAQSNGCDVYQAINSSQTYYLLNPGFPLGTKDSKNCTYRAYGANTIRINCTVELPDLNGDCQNHFIQVNTDPDDSQSIENKFCGDGSFLMESVHNRITITYTLETSGTLFCTITGEPGYTMGQNDGRNYYLVGE